MGTIVVFKQELGTYPWTMHILNSWLRKKRRDSSAYSKCSAEIQSGLESRSRAAFEEVVSTKQKNTWAFQDPDSSPCSLCCVPLALQTHWQSLIFPWNRCFGKISMGKQPNERISW